MSNLSDGFDEFIRYAVGHTDLKSHKYFGKLVRELAELVKQNDVERAADKDMREFARYLYSQVLKASAGDSDRIDYELVAKGMRKRGFAINQEELFIEEDE